MDQVRAQHLLLERIGIKYLKLVLGTSMGGMQTWLWGEMFPNDIDCLVAIASTPAAISGRNMIWREMISQSIRNDPDWKNGDYPKDSPPKNWIKAAIPLSAIMTGSAEQLQNQAPTRQTAIDLVDKLEAGGDVYDANDFLYAFESSADYDPAPKLNEITKPIAHHQFCKRLDQSSRTPALTYRIELHRSDDSVWLGHLRSHDTRAPCCLGFRSWVLLGAPPALAITSVAIVHLFSIRLLSSTAASENGLHPPLCIRVPFPHGGECIAAALRCLDAPQ
jgi:hypothetical protein